MKNVTYEIQGKFITFFVDGAKTTTVTSENVEECIKNYIEMVNFVPTENDKNYIKMVNFVPTENESTESMGHQYDTETI